MVRVIDLSCTLMAMFIAHAKAVSVYDPRQNVQCSSDIMSNVFGFGTLHRIHSKPRCMGIVTIPTLHSCLESRGVF